MGGGYRKKTTDTCGSDFIMTEKLKEYMDILIHRKKEFVESDIESSLSMRHGSGKEKVKQARREQLKRQRYAHTKRLACRNQFFMWNINYSLNESVRMTLVIACNNS